MMYSNLGLSFRWTLPLIGRKGNKTNHQLTHTHTTNTKTLSTKILSTKIQSTKYGLNIKKKKGKEKKTQGETKSFIFFIKENEKKTQKETKAFISLSNCKNNGRLPVLLSAKLTLYTVLKDK